MRVITYLIAIFILLFGITFAILNAEPVSINYYVAQRTMPLSLLLVMTFIFGCLIGLMATFVIYIKQKSQIHHLKHRIKTMEKEITNLRIIPLRDSH
jgi:putative membrane protein